MSTALEKLSRHKTTLGAAQIGSALAALGVFYVFYVVLGNSLLIATPLAVAAFVALWQVLVAPLQKQAIKIQANKQNVAALEKKIVDLQTLAGKIGKPDIRAKVLAMAGHFRYALNVQRDSAEPLAQMTAQTLTNIALGWTASLVTSYLALEGKKRLTNEELATTRQAETFIHELAAKIDGQTEYLRDLTEGARDQDTGLQANMAALQMLFDMPPKEGDDL